MYGGSLVDAPEITGGREQVWVGVVVGLCVALVFSPTIAFDFVNWDDGIFVYENPLVTDPGAHDLGARLATAHVGYPVPATVWIYGLLWAWGGGSALPFHALNVVLHGINAGLLYRLLRRRKLTTLRCAVGAMAFGLHPITVEPVAWVTGLKDLLMTFGVLLAIDAVTAGDDPTGPWRRRLLAPLSGLLALLAKPTAVIVGPVLAGFVAERWRREGDRRRVDVWAVVVLLTALGAALALWTMTHETEQLRTRAEVPFSIVRVIGALGLALQHLAAPATSAPVYGFDQVSALHVVLAVMVVAAGVGLAVWRPPARPWLLLALLAWLPVSNVVPLERFTADSYLYLPWLGIVGAIATGLPQRPDAKFDDGDRDMASRRRRNAVVAFAFVGVWGVLSVVGSQSWRSNAALWETAYGVRPEDPRIIHRYGEALGRAGEDRAEFALYLEHLDALRSGEQVPVALPVYFEHSGDLERAAEWYGEAFARPNQQPEALYINYVEFVARHPERHSVDRDAALRYALPLYLASPAAGKLPKKDRRALERLSKAVKARYAGSPPS